jgi:hypothetical protein
VWREIAEERTSMRALVIDDSRAIRMLIRQYLCEMDVEVFER